MVLLDAPPKKIFTKGNFMKRFHSPVLEKYKSALFEVERYLKEDLKALKIQSALIYGSSVYPNCFKDGTSDIDICAFTDVMNEKRPDEICSVVRASHESFKDKPPVFMDDYIARRIEFYIQRPDISFDITLLALQIPRIDKMLMMPVNDGIDMVLGAFYQHGVPLFGQIPGREWFFKNAYPFYKDELRQARLEIIEKRLDIYLKRVQDYAVEKNPDTFDHFLKTRALFLKWLFIHKKKYPVCLHKHLDYQLGCILKLPAVEKDILLCHNQVPVSQAIGAFLDLSHQYLKQAKSERMATINAQTVASHQKFNPLIRKQTRSLGKSYE